MKVEHKEHAVIIKDTLGDSISFLEKLTHEYATFAKHNLVLDISKEHNSTLETIKLFADLSKTHKKAKKSFVLVAKGIDFNKVSVKMTVVPSLQEAHDIIEIEEIERDLGF